MEPARAPQGRRVAAVGSIFLVALFLGLMSFLILPTLPPVLFSGVGRLAMETGAGIRDHWEVCASAFALLFLITGLGYADRLLKPLTWAALATLAFFLLATWWALRTAPGGLIKL
ncbi:MAG TPA: hypothetical protein VGK61_07710 [Planctomycetota bacterium]|jgi:hypothetical protein